MHEVEDQRVQQECCACCVQTVVNYDDSDPNWDMLVAPFTSCVSYVKDLSPLNFGDQVRRQHPLLLFSVSSYHSLLLLLDMLGTATPFCPLVSCLLARISQAAV